MASLLNFTSCLKMNTNHLQTLQKKLEEGTLPNIFCEASITLKQNQTETSQENHRPIFLITRNTKILNKITAN